MRLSGRQILLTSVALGVLLAAVVLGTSRNRRIPIDASSVPISVIYQPVGELALPDAFSSPESMVRIAGALPRCFGPVFSSTGDRLASVTLASYHPRHRQSLIYQVVIWDMATRRISSRIPASGRLLGFTRRDSAILMWDGIAVAEFDLSGRLLSRRLVPIRGFQQQRGTSIPELQLTLVKASRGFWFAGADFSGRDAPRLAIWQPGKEFTRTRHPATSIEALGPEAEWVLYGLQSWSRWGGGLLVASRARGQYQPVPAPELRLCSSPAVSSDGRWIAAGGENGEISAFSTADWKPHRTYRPRAAAATPPRRAYCLAVSPDGRTIVFHSGTAGVSVVDIGTETVVASLPARARRSSASFSPDGHQLAICDGGQIRLYSRVLIDGALHADTSAGG